MLSHDENELLCRVGASTPMGRMFRRYWVPALLSDELPPKSSKRVRLFGESLVVFRTASGELGLLDEACPHRGASLVLARNEDCALRCIYHGWAFDTQGNVMETPPEPSDSTFRSRVRAIAYEVYEAGGVIWAYLGPAGEAPPRLSFEWTSAPASRRVIMKSQIDCNWLQAYEGAVDSSHTNYLHTDAVTSGGGETQTTLRPDATLERPSNDGAPRIEVEHAAYGFRYAAIRRPLRDAETNRYVRVSLYVAPFYSIFPAPRGWSYMQMFVPIDDVTTMWYYVQCASEGEIDQERRELAYLRGGVVPGVDMDAQFRRHRSRDNDWLQDREAMKDGRSFSGLAGINAEDIAVTESMGPVYDRTKEHLGASDVAVIRLRRLLLDAVRRFDDGTTPALGLAAPVDYERLRASEGMIKDDESWNSLTVDTEYA
jgi:phthalate 4,5-dioxygenase oxygenase subunit